MKEAKKINMSQEYFEHIKVYKTDVKDSTKAQELLGQIRSVLPGSDPSFDLEDCDKVLRVETQKTPKEDMKIRELVKASGHHIEELP